MLRVGFMLLSIDADIFPEKKGVFIVGGSIRDLLLGRKPMDYDLAVKEDPAAFARQLAARIDGHMVQFGQHDHTVLRVIGRDNFFDILPLNGGTIEEDLLQRDFTINAMALEVASGSLIDPVGGRQDLSARKVRMVAGDVFQKDSVRLVRAYRMAASFDFTIDPDTEKAIIRDADLITRSAAERTREEFVKILESGRSHAQLGRMADSGLLFSVFPELQVLKNYHLPDHQPNMLWDQTLASYGQFENLCAPGRQTRPLADGRLFEAADIARSSLLKWSALFHSIGKPAALSPGGAGALQFSGYAAKSAVLARTICQRLKFSRQQTDQIQLIVEHHCRPIFLFKAWQKKVPISRAFVRFFLKCGDLSPDILRLALAICEGRRSPKDPADLEFAEFILARIEEYDTVLQPRAALPPPLNGNDLIREFGLKPSAEFKRILKYIEQERLTRRCLTREQALEMVQHLLRRSESSQE